jgi:tripartite-type tricarboxylate transporter receptor subunit TctC
MLQKTIGFAVALSLGGAVTAAADYPSRDITAVVGWAAGGGTDVAARILATEVQEPPPVRINVTNRTGGVAGLVGLRYAS